MNLRITDERNQCSYGTGITSGKKSGFVTQIKSLKRICHFAAANVSLLINAMYILIDVAVG